MDLSLTELYLGGVLGIVTFLYIRLTKKYERAMFAGSMLTEAITLAADGKATITRAKSGEIQIVNTENSDGNQTGQSESTDRT